MLRIVPDPPRPFKEQTMTLTTSFVVAACFALSGVIPGVRLPNPPPNIAT